MQKIKSLADACLNRQPKLNNIALILLELLSTQHTIKQKLFISSQLVKVFEALHVRGSFDKITQQFLNEKKRSFLQLLLQLAQENEQFNTCLISMVSVCQAKNLIQILKDHQQLWEQINDYNKIAQIVQVSIKQDLNTRIQCLLKLPQIEFLETEDQPQQTKQSEGLEITFKKAFQTLLFSVLKDSSLTDESYKTLVQSFPQKIFPRILSPLNLSEHIFHKYSQTHNLELKISLLSSLFILIGKYGLEIENFYTQLYNLIELRNQNNQSVFEVSNSKKVMKMIQNSLRSSKVSFNVLVKFLKALINRCLFENTSFVCWVMALSFNLFKKHQLLSHCLNPQSDMYVPEFSIIQNHFLPQIQSLVKKLEKSLNKEEFLDIAEFSTIDLQKALKHQIQNVPEATILVPRQIGNLLL